MRTIILAFLFFSTLVATAQQAPAVNPVPVNEEPMHKVVLENDYVQVMHVLVPPGQSTQFHTHSHDGVAVRLSNAKTNIDVPGEGKPGATIVSHPGLVTAQPYAEHPFTHRVNNVGTTDFEVLDIEILKRPEGPTTKPIGLLTAENPSARVYTYELPPGVSSEQHTHERPYLIIAATPMKLAMTGADGKATAHDLKAGDFHWIDSKVTHTLTNQGEANAVIVEVELK
jgi:quercetin dioxygenase-like cupin family protein